MRLTCPLCGERDCREFFYQGAASMLQRPEPDASLEEWNAYLHNRDNPAGETKELWYHEAGCGSWIKIRRNTMTHEVLAASLLENVDAG